MRLFTIVTLASLATTGLAGCATIVHGSTQAVSVKSQPEGASFTITNVDGAQVHAGVTPAVVTLQRGAGYFRPQHYTIKMQKEGFAPREIVVSGSMSGWFFGNIAFGGVIGMVAVDPVTGAMFKLPESVEETLEAAPAKAAAGVPSLTFVSTESLTPAQRASATLLAVAR